MGSFHLLKRSTSDQLLGSYLRSFETIYRILHVPTLKRDNEIVLQNPTVANTPIIIRLQLCLAIGACTHDDVFSFRPHALQWIHEAEQWLASSDKCRLTLIGIQIMCLLYLARQTTESLYGDQLWVFSGVLLRSAMCMGLHRDPARLPGTSVFQAEMHKRLWATILEFVLDASIDSSQPVLLSPEDFDCGPPANLDDNQLDIDSSTHPAPKSPDQYTDTSLQIALGRSFAIRLAILKQSACIKPESNYQAVLGLSSQLVAARQSLMSAVCSFQPQTSQFQRQYFDIITLRYVFTLHLPYMPLSDPAFCFSHKACVDAALKLSYFTLPLSSDKPFLTALRAATDPGDQCPYFTRLFLCGSGSFRSTQFIAISVIATDLAAIVAEEEMSRGGSTLRITEQRSLLCAGLEWAEKRIRAGQENVKDYVYFAVVYAGIEAAMKGESPNRAMAEGGREALSHATALLTEIAGGPTMAWDETPGLDGCDLNIAGNFWTSDFPDLSWDDSET